MDRQRSRLARVVGSAAGVLWCVSVLASPSWADAGDEFKQLIDRHAKSIVTIKFVMKMQMGGMGGEEAESEIAGVMVDPKGLVLCANSQLAGPAGLLKRFMPPGMNLTSEPTDLKVIIGSDEAEYEAKIIARDTDLDLAWVKMEKTEDKTFASVDLNDNASIGIGEKLLSVRRMGKQYNRAPAVRTGRVCGETDTPRQLYIGNMELGTSVGLPVFTTSGKLAGMVVMQAPDEEGSQPTNPLSMLGSMGSMAEMFMGVILPAKSTARATKHVQETYVAGEGEGEK